MSGQGTQSAGSGQCILVLRVAFFALVVALGAFTGCDDTGNGSTSVVFVSPRWSPNNSYIAVFSGKADGGTISGSMDLDLADLSGRILRRVGSGFASVSSVEWSPSGSGLEVAQSTGNPVIVDTAGGKVSIGGLEGGTAADWSPDGTEIIFAGQGVGDSEAKLYVVNARSGFVSLLNDSLPGGVFAVYWSSAGSIAVLYHRNYRGYLALLSRSGTDFRILDSVGLVFSSISWSPDGRGLLYTASAAPYRIYELDIASNLRREVTQRISIQPLFDRGMVTC